MTYDIHITRAAEHDINGAADHIEYVLFNPQAADSLLDEVEKMIESLPAFPQKHPIVDDPVWNCPGAAATANGPGGTSPGLVLHCSNLSPYLIHHGNAQL